ncbi:hypothetical protein X777_01410 [Ooceraea biroi]|uniref:Uncharacterized protein n=1 Tax=Ooceraea biroi TaxID=2015173 RepID=A0A026WSG3_OOCBI|nr:hypothetical protein X777_01410 [Ooceraea biroi]
MSRRTRVVDRCPSNARSSGPFCLVSLHASLTYICETIALLKHSLAHAPRWEI